MLKFFQRNKNKNKNKNIKDNTDTDIDKDNLKTDINQKDIKTQDNLNNLSESDLAVTKESLFSKLYTGLTKTRKQLFSNVTSLFTGKVKIDEELWEELLSSLILADVGIDLSKEILNELTKEINFKDSQDVNLLKLALKTKLISILKPCEQNLDINNPDLSPFVILMVGVNGAGKTTTIGKLASQFKATGHLVMLAAGDTFRAAAIEQLTTWGERNNVPVVAQQSGSDSASVIFDAYQSAKAKKVDILIADTAGRLHTQTHLMQELAKIKRVLAKQQTDQDKTIPQEVLLVIDASQGQNALVQAKFFLELINVTGIVITKLDGTAKGGIVFAIAKQLKIPIRYIGVGEGIDDLQKFNSKDFVDAFIGN